MDNSFADISQKEQDKVVLKSMKVDRDWDEDSMDRHRRDAVIAEHLTSSPHIMNIHAACANSALYESAQKSLGDAIGAEEYLFWITDEHREKQEEWRSWTSRKKMQVAFQAVQAVADLHGIDGDRPSIVHGDMDITQFISSDNGKTYKLNDCKLQTVMSVVGRKVGPEGMFLAHFCSFVL